jgi:epsilon-lactone hydrolase
MIQTQREYREMLEKAVDIEEIRRLDATEIPKWSGPLPGDVEFKTVDADGVPAEWLTPPGALRERVILYVHGGGYILGSPATVRTPISKSARLARAHVMLPKYRLAPEHLYPAAIEDIVTAYRWLLRNGYPADGIILAGESAGGGAVIASLLALRDAGDPLPAGAVPISPAVDFECRFDSWTRNADREGFVYREGSLRNVSTFLGGGDPRAASPLNQNLAGLPPLLVLAGEAECSVDASVALGEKARAAGVDVTLKVFDGMTHLWQNFSYLPEAAEALEMIGRFVEAHVPSERRQDSPAAS